MNKISVFWTQEAENDLDLIYDYYFEKSPIVALRLINEIIASTESLVFSNQYQIEDYKSDCRRIVIKNYKVLYTIEIDSIYIVRVFDSRRSNLTM